MVKYEYECLKLFKKKTSKIIYLVHVGCSVEFLTTISATKQFFIQPQFVCPEHMQNDTRNT